jgi:hypothetical protein
VAEGWIQLRRADSRFQQLGGRAGPHFVACMGGLVLSWQLVLA